MGAIENIRLYNKVLFRDYSLKQQSSVIYIYIYIWYDVDLGFDWVSTQKSIDDYLCLKCFWSKRLEEGSRHNDCSVLII